MAFCIFCMKLPLYIDESILNRNLKNSNTFRLYRSSSAYMKAESFSIASTEFFTADSFPLLSTLHPESSMF